MHYHRCQHEEMTDLLFAAMRLRLRDGFSEDLFKLVALQSMLSVEGDETIQTVKQFVLNEVVLYLTSLRPRLDSTMTDNSLAPSHNHIMM